MVTGTQTQSNTSNSQSLTELKLNKALSEWQQWPACFTSRPIVIKRLALGRTNVSFIIADHDQFYILRIASIHSASLGIDRPLEHRIYQSLKQSLTPSLTLAQANTQAQAIAPEYVYANKEYCYSVFKYIDGRLWTEKDFQDRSQRKALKDIVASFQSVQVDGPKFDYLSYLEHYYAQLASLGLPDQLLQKREFCRFVDKFTAFITQSWQPVLCHHDLSPSNIIETNEGICIIDWEYAGLGHPEFDEHYIDSFCLDEYARRTQQISPLSDSGLHHGDIMDQLIQWLNYYWELLKNYS